MSYELRRSKWMIMASVGFAFGLVGSVAAAGEAEDIAAVIEATAKYADVSVALAEGYVPAPSGCVTAAGEGLPAELGDMGVHYIHPGKLKLTATEPRVDGDSTNTDFLNPSVLLYEPQADGSLELLAVENLVFQAAWSEAGNDDPPTFAGKPYDVMADDPNTAMDEAHEFEPHFDRHVWILRENPNGVFTPFNPAVTCEHFE